MKINEFEKRNQVDEGIGNALSAAARAGFGDRAISGIKGSFTGAGSEKQLAYDLFVKDFIKDAIVSLQNAVNSGIVVPGAADASPDVDPKDDPEKKIEEYKYNKLNQIFESIVNEIGKQSQPVEGAESISDYMLSWFGQWMHGVDWKTRETPVKALIKAIEANYPKGNWKGAIQQLAKAAYSISSAGTSVPKGVENADSAGSPGPKTVGDFGVGDGPGPVPVARHSGTTPDDEEKMKAFLKANPELKTKYPEIVKKLGL